MVISCNRVDLKRQVEGCMEESLKALRKKALIKKIIGLLVVVIIVCMIGAFYYVNKAKMNEASGNKDPGERNTDLVQMGDSVIATGTTTVGMNTEEIELSYLETELLIEEVYLNNGNQVEENTPILKIASDDIEEAKWELKRKVVEAQLAYRQGKMDYLTGETEAQAVYDTTLKETEFAETEYQNSLANAELELSELEQKVEDALELYTEYSEGIENNAYYEEYEVASKKELYETNKSLYEEYLKRWNIEDREVNTSGGENTANTNMQGGMGGAGSSTDKQERLTALGLLEDEYRENLEEYEQASEEYVDALATAKASISSAKADYELQTLELEQGKIDYDKKAASYLATYESAILKSETAQNTYQTAMKKLKEELNQLENDLEDATENQNEFQSLLGEGCLNTTNRGDVVMITVRENSLLNDADMVLAYSNPDTVMVNASVDQANIASLEVGDEASVTIEEVGTFTGIITEINPISNSSSKASVTYSVVVTLQGDISTVSANKTATVFFGTTPEEGGNHETQEKAH